MRQNKDKFWFNQLKKLLQKSIKINELCITTNWYVYEKEKKKKTHTHKNNLDYIQMKGIEHKHWFQLSRRLRNGDFKSYLKKSKQTYNT